MKSIAKYTVYLLGGVCLLVAACNGSSDSKDANKDTATTGLDAAAASGPSSDQTVPYIVAENYFVNNSVQNPVPDKITSQADFDKYFGKASTMGASGKPTPIDFDKQFVIALDHPTTTKKTEIIPVGLIKNGSDIVFNYRVTEGDSLSFSIHPLLVLVVDNQYGSGQLILHKQ